jgi:hypothetical protein
MGWEDDDGKKKMMGSGVGSFRVAVNRGLYIIVHCL